MFNLGDCRDKIASLEAKVAELKGRLQDWEDSAKHAEKSCPGDMEMHCSCVFPLQKTIERLRGLLVEAEAWFRQHPWGAYSCPKNDEAKAFVDRLAKALKEGE